MTIDAGTRVSVVQSPGGSVTVRTDRRLLRISEEDADALSGFRPEAVVPVAALESSVGFGEAAVWDVLKTCYDSGISVNIADLGLVYDFDIAKTLRAVMPWR